MEASELLKQALTLPDKVRADLAASLIDSLGSVVDEGVEAAWQEEVARRLKEFEAGKVKAIPWDEVRREARALLDGR